MEIEQSVDYINLKRIFDELFDRVAQRVVVVPKEKGSDGVIDEVSTIIE
jgi:hypothetical protein